MTNSRKNLEKELKLIILNYGVHFFYGLEELKSKELITDEQRKQLHDAYLDWAETLSAFAEVLDHERFVEIFKN